VRNANKLQPIWYTQELCRRGFAYIQETILTISLPQILKCSGAVLLYLAYIKFNGGGG